MMLISAADLIALYLGLELMSLALYVVAAINRDNVRSTEAGLKYFVLGALSSGMLLYGASLIYGFTGTVSFAGIAKAAGQGGIGLIFGLVFLFAGFCFKVSAVPFHMWTPDVYEGAPTPVTAFFAAAPKVAAHRDLRARADHGVPRHHAAMAADRRLRRRSPRWCSASFAAIGQTQHQAADGLFVDRPHGLRAGRARRRHARRACRACSIYMAIYVAMTLGTFAVHPVDAARRTAGREHHRSRRPRAHQPGDGVLPRHADVLARRHSAARGLLRQVLRVPRRHQGRALSRSP